jgi:hypothetical protein
MRNSKIDIESLSDADLDDILKKKIKMKLRADSSNFKTQFINQKSKIFQFFSLNSILFNQTLN